MRFCLHSIFVKAIVRRIWLKWLAQVVLAGIVQDWPADKIVKVYEICFSNKIVTGAVAGRNSVQMRRKLSVMISPIDGGARPIKPQDYLC